ncbi:MAG: hypothetical protein WD512_06225 [Candidatus Paceibacterota bacterium]
MKNIENTINKNKINCTEDGSYISIHRPNGSIRSICTECGKPITKKELNRKSSMLYRPFISDCEACEILALNILNK